MQSLISRRQALLTAAAAAGVSWFDVPRVLGESPKADNARYGGRPMGIQSFSLRGYKTDVAIQKIHELGLHYVEFFRSHLEPTTDPARLRPVLDRLAEYGIKLNCHGVQSFDANHEKNKAFFEFAKLAGIKTISADFKPEAHDSLQKLVKEYDIRIAGHNHGPGHHWSKITDLKNQIEGLDPRIGACADLGHYIRSGEDPVEAIHAFKGRLWDVHLKDFKEPKKDAKGCILGEGVMNIQAVFKALKAVNFPADAVLSLEYEENPQDPMEDIRKCLAAASEAAQKVAKG